MSETDSFIDEVTEEVRRDKLFSLFRKYGWIGVALVLLIVGGAAWNEWQKARSVAAAQAFGDQIAAAMQQKDAAGRLDALSAIKPDGAGRAVVLRFLTAADAEAAGDKARALEGLKAISEEGGLSQVYRQLADLKIVMLQGADMDPGERDATLSRLAAPGGFYRTLAMEEQAMALLDQGKPDDAVALLQRIGADADAPEGQKARIAQILTALGQEPANG